MVVWGGMCSRHDELCKENFARHLLNLWVILRHLAIFFLSADTDRCTAFGPKAKASAHNEQSPLLNLDVFAGVFEEPEPLLGTEETRLRLAP